MLRRIRKIVRPDGGFTLPEAMAAIAIVAVVFVAVSQTLLGGLTSVRNSRLFEQSSNLAKLYLEEAEDTPYDDVSMITSDLTGDANIVTGPKFDPDGTGALVAEPVVSSASGGTVNPHIVTETLGGVAFTVKQYVTWVDDATQGGATQDYKRFVVHVTWPSGNRTFSYKTSAILSRSGRGLPVPRFDLAPPAQTVGITPGNPVVFPHTITNYGIDDTYNLVMPMPVGQPWTVTFYADVDEDGIYDIGSDTVLVDTNGDGITDTGSVPTDEVFYFLAVINVPSSQAVGSYLTTLTGTSGADPTVARSAADTLSVGRQFVTLYLHNNPTPPVGDTTAQIDMPMNVQPPSATTLRKYSTNYYTRFPGRMVSIPKGAPGQHPYDTRYMANWIYQVPELTVFDGQVDVRLFAEVKDRRCNKRATWDVVLLEKSSPNGNSGTVIGTAQGRVRLQKPNCNMQAAVATFNLSRTIAANKWLEVRLYAEKVAAGRASLWGYDTTTFASYLRLQKVTS